MKQVNNKQLIRNTNPKVGIEFTILDSKNRSKKVLMFFDQNEDWFTSLNYTDIDVLGFFAGNVMELFKRDKETTLIQAQAFNIQNSMVKKSITFTAQGKVNGIFKQCLPNQDGTFEVI